MCVYTLEYATATFTCNIILRRELEKPTSLYIIQSRFFNPPFFSDFNSSLRIGSNLDAQEMKQKKQGNSNSNSNSNSKALYNF